MSMAAQISRELDVYEEAFTKVHADLISATFVDFVQTTPVDTQHARESVVIVNGRGDDIPAFSGTAPFRAPNESVARSHLAAYRPLDPGVSSVTTNAGTADHFRSLDNGWSKQASSGIVGPVHSRTETRAALAAAELDSLVIPSRAV